MKFLRASFIYRKATNFYNNSTLSITFVNNSKMQENKKRGEKKKSCGKYFGFFSKCGSTQKSIVNYYLFSRCVKRVMWREVLKRVY